MRDRLSPAFALILGLCIATVSFTLWAVETTAFDPGSLRHQARAMLDESPVQRSMQQRVAAAIALKIPSGLALEPTVLAEVSARAVEQPAFVDAFAGGLEQVRGHIIDGANSPINLDPALVAQAVNAAAGDQASLTTALASPEPLVVQIPDDEMPDLARWADYWQSAVRVLAFLSLLLITYGFLRLEHRVWAIGRIGRWAIAVGVGTLVVFWVVPRAVLHPMGGWIAVGGTVITGSDLLLSVALVLIAVGLVAVVAAHRWEAADRKRVLAVIPRSSARVPKGSNPWESPV